METGATAEFQINLLGYRIRLVGPSEIIAPLEQSLFTRCREACISPPDDSYELKASENRFSLRRKGKASPPLLEGVSRTEVFRWLDGSLWEGALSRQRGVLQIRGAAAMKGGEAVLLLGDHGAGKSAIVIELLQRGYHFLTDEVILINSKTLLVRPFLRNVLVREPKWHGESIRRNCADAWVFEFKSGNPRWFLDPALLGPAGPAGEAEVGDVIWLEQSEKGPAVLERMGMRAMVMRLSQSTMNLGEFGAEGMDAIMALVRPERNFLLRAPNPGAAWERLRERVLQPQAEPEGGGIKCARKSQFLLQERDAKGEIPY